MTGFAVTDIEIYKDGGTTQRASDSGYVLLDTDGTDFDGLTGIHGFSIDLADNTTAGFYASGSQYFVVVSSITVDAGVVSFIAATFRIGITDALLNTTIATLASQTSFTLTAGPAEDNALVGCVVYIHDVASAVQGGFAVISAYTGSTKTVTLAAGTTYTVATSDNISVLSPANSKWFGATAVTGRDLGASVLLSSGTGTGQVTLTSGRVNADVTHIATAAVSTSTAQLGVNVVNAAGTAWGSGAITAAAVAASALNGKGDWNFGKTGYTLTATTGLGNQTANITGNLSGSVGSVTGAVGSVTGNVSGSVASVASGGISAASFSAGAIDAAAIAANAIGASELATDATEEIADALLNRNVAGSSNSGRLVKEALYALRNKVVVNSGTMTVYSTDDATSAWTASVTGTAGADPITTIDPA